MRGLLVRIGADLSKVGGGFNGPVNSGTGEFVYVPIPENREVHQGMERPYALMLGYEDVHVPHRLQAGNMHLDPDFEYLTYGDEEKKGAKIRTLCPGDFLVFYAGLRDRNHIQAGGLVYAIVGFYVITEILNPRDIPLGRHDENAHTRCAEPHPPRNEIVVRADSKKSGRLERCLLIGSYRLARNRNNRRPCYRVDANLLDQWGGLSVNDGYIHRGVCLPEFRYPARFLNWFYDQRVDLVARNN